VTTVESRPFIRLRGRSFMALVLAPESPLEGWLSALDAQIDRSPSFFDGRPVVLDLALLPPDQPDMEGFMQELDRRGIRVIGTEGAHPSWKGIEAWGRPMPSGGRPARDIDVSAESPPATPPPKAAAPQENGHDAPSLLVSRPVRSGQSVVFERGDETVIGSVATGAEVMAGGSVHVYGTLRGRAIAGLAGNGGARIFCQKLDAELLAIDGVYQTADDMDPSLRGRPVQAWLDGEQMKLTALD
jgi:septum site-determining protein MinC